MQKSKKSQLIAVRVDRAFAERIRKLAEQEHRTLSQVIRMLLEKWAA